MKSDECDVVSLDFDGTLVSHAYPYIGKDIGAVPWLLHLQKHGVLFVLNTMRSDKELQEAVDWCGANGIALYGINVNPNQHSWTTSPKVSADVYVDDLALGAPLTYFPTDSRPHLDWAKAGPMLCKRVGLDVPEKLREGG